MMENKSNCYRIKLEESKQKDDELKTLEFEFSNHDDLFKVIEMVKSKNLFDNENYSIEFALGLKLFSEVMLKHKDHPLFEELKPAFGLFMKKLKGKNNE